MVVLANWLETHREQLVHDAVEELSQNLDLRSQVTASVDYFFNALLQAAVLNSSAPLDAVLLDWVEARSAPTDEDTAALIAVLMKLKEVTWLRIREMTEAALAVDLLSQADMLYTDALTYLSKLEGDILLSRMRQQLDEAHAHVQHLNKRKTDFVAVAAHELRTPLTLIEGYADMLRSMNDSPDINMLKMMLDGIDGGVKRLRGIIRDMIDVSLINLGALELHLQVTWLPSIVRAVEKRVIELIPDRNLSLVVDHDTLPRNPIYADPERLMQMLEKIVMNAVKYTPDSGAITIAARQLQAFTDLVVTDTGIGINPEDLPRIFDTFSSLGDVALHSSSKTKFKGGGPGLGLSIAKGIIEAHGGTIWAESSGRDETTLPGTSFHIMIPMRPVPVDAMR